MNLIVGLGNPGRPYARNRHNVGFQCLDFFAGVKGLEFGRRQFNAVVAFGEVAGKKVVLAKPQTFMNRSGESVGPLLRYYRLSLADLLLVYDDLDLPVGRIRVREKGSAGGHKGVQSAIACVGSQEFARIRVGIGRPSGMGDEILSYVLGNFAPDEQKIIDEVKEKVAEAIEAILTDGVAAAMNRFNA